MRPTYYDREGNPIDLLRWGELLEDPEYRCVTDTTLPDGTWISTVWLGLDHSMPWNDGPPLIFETMVFPRQGEPVSLAEFLAGDPRAKAWSEQEAWRWPTEAAARAGHDQTVAKITEALDRLGAALAEMEGFEQNASGEPPAR